MIFSGVQDWNENPVLMTVDTFDRPLKTIDFPAITLCASDSFQPDNWLLTEKVFNSFEFNCKPGNDDCKEIREDLKPFLRLIFDLVSQKIDEFEFEPSSVLGESKFSDLWDTLTPNKLNHVYWAMKDNKLDSTMMNEIIVDVVGRKDVELYDLLPKQYNGSNDCDEVCLEMKQEIIKGFIKADVLVNLYGMPLGTMLRQFSDQIGFAFQNEPMNIWVPGTADWSKCEHLEEVQNMIFELMKKMATQFGLKASLHDIPNVFAKGFNSPVAQFYPLFSICSLGYFNIRTANMVSLSN